jgi:hypothetical protein
MEHVRSCSKLSITSLAYERKHALNHRRAFTCTSCVFVIPYLSVLIFHSLTCFKLCHLLPLAFFKNALLLHDPCTRSLNFPKVLFIAAVPRLTAVHLSPEDIFLCVLCCLSFSSGCIMGSLWHSRTLNDFGLSPYRSSSPYPGKRVTE